MTLIANLLLVTALAVANPAAPDHTSAPAPSPGRFIYVGPTDAAGDALSMKWRYQFRFDPTPAADASIRFSCDPIPESAVALRGADLKINDRGFAFVDSAPVVVSKQATPWLFDPAATKAICRATVAGADGKRSEEAVPLAFSAESKSVLLATLKESFEFNKKSTPAH